MSISGVELLLENRDILTLEVRVHSPSDSQCYWRKKGLKRYSRTAVQSEASRGLYSQTIKGSFIQMKEQQAAREKYWCHLQPINQSQHRQRGRLVKLTHALQFRKVSERGWNLGVSHARTAKEVVCRKIHTTIWKVIIIF